MCGTVAAQAVTVGWWRWRCRYAWGGDFRYSPSDARGRESERDRRARCPGGGLWLEWPDTGGVMALDDQTVSCSRDVDEVVKHLG